ncbi:MAG: L-serine ammonia-lyase, iron-sulfur-dependent, subunit alpha [Christensenellales bacterium]|nr:L-serine ammonia-lyase, iron-sulfur-dependent, subunit alpha [Christensenellales bacterium]
MDQALMQFFLQSIRETVKPSTGCTEPGAVALNTALARRHARGAFRRLSVRMDEFLFKNAMGVGIPGSDERGVALCAALGVTAGNPDLGLCALENVTPEQLARAKQMVADKLVEVSICPSAAELFIQSTLETDEDAVRVTTCERHDNILEIVHAPFPEEVATGDGAHDAPILAHTLEEMLAFARSVPLEDLAFLEEGLRMNLAIAEAGSELEMGRAMRALIRRGALGQSPMTQAKFLCASAAYARMSGVSLPVMSATGSGNQGITVTLTIEGTAQALASPRETKLRALALAHLVNLYGKAHIGNLSALCSCGISSGLGASVGIVYMLGGTLEQMLLAAKNMIGSICGMICDGAKEGCANKVELAAGLAVQSAFLAVENMGIPGDNGILSSQWQRLFENLGALARRGMRETNRVIVDIMRAEQG